MKRFETKRIAIKDIDLGDRARRTYKNLDELAQSIRTNGLINPLTLVDKEKVQDWKNVDKDSLTEDKRYLLLAGGRRFHALRKSGVDEVDGRIYEKILTQEEIKTVELEENLQRVGLEWAEEVSLKRQIHDLQQKIHGKSVRGGGVNRGKGHSLKDTAEMLEQSESTVIKDIKLAKALERMPQLAEAKTKSDAEKMLKRLSKDINSEKVATTIQQRRASTPVEKQRKALYDSYMIRDCRDGMRKIESETIDIVEIDPPYAIDLKSNKRSHSTVTDGYNEVSSDDFMELMPAVLSESHRIMKKHAWLILWFGPDPWFQIMLDMLRKHNFTVRGIPGIWSKGRGQTNRPALHLANTYEMFFYARKGEPGLKKQGRANVFDYPPVNSGSKIHPTERPVELIEDLLMTFGSPTNRVCVPFLGSGNTLLAASNAGMTGFGWELTKTYKDRFVEKVDQAQPGAYRSYGR